jgi:hypothetical protein
MKQVEPPKRGRGRPRKDPTGPQVRVSVRITPTDAERLAQRYGSAEEGIRKLIEGDRTK